MTDAIGDDVPWCALKWSLTIYDAAGPVDLTMAQTLAVFAAVELDRVWSLDDVRKAMQGRELWAGLMAGANGLRPADAPGGMTMRAIFARLGAVRVEWHVHQTRAAQQASATAAVERLRSEAA